MFPIRALCWWFDQLRWDCGPRCGGFFWTVQGLLHLEDVAIAEVRADAARSRSRTCFGSDLRPRALHADVPSTLLPILLTLLNDIKPTDRI